MKKENYIKGKYGYENFNPEKLDRENINYLSVSRIKKNSSVLEIGCASGDIGDYLQKKKYCTVLGVEIDPLQVQIAQKKLGKIIEGDIEDIDILNMVKKTKPNNFDVVLAMAVIEHLVDPLSTLKNLRKVLKQNGKIIVTLPNVAHWSVRFSLLRGRFDYEEYGIMDRTHLHFYTIKTAKELLRESGYRITEIAFDSVGGGYPRFSRFMAKFFPNIFAYQILLIGQKN